jgi:alkylated DNA repair dioxygenase AlkB
LASFCFEGNIKNDDIVLHFCNRMTTVCLVKTEKSFLNISSYEEHKDLIDRCIEDVSYCLDIKPSIQFMGKTVSQQRDVGFFSNKSVGYFYSGKLAASKPLKENMCDLLAIVNTQFNSEYNGILVNRYNDGTNYISDHSDSENTIGDSGVIAISHGAVRKFRIRDKKTREKVIDILTTPYSLIQMGGNFQAEFSHGIPVEKKIKEERYSLTFRKHLI